jgi:hypothetical protein
VRGLPHLFGPGRSGVGYNPAVLPDVFHAACVAELRKFKLKQVCPLCRTPLPPGPDKLHEEATLRYLVLDRRVERGKASWGALTKDEQGEMHPPLPLDCSIL